MIRLGSFCLVLLLTLTCSSAALADRKLDAHAAENRAAHAFAKADYATALTEYQSSYDTYPKPYLLFRIGECQRLLGKPEAVETYKLFLTKVTHGADRRKAKEYVSELDVKNVSAMPDKEVVEAAPAPQAQDAESAPVTAEEIAKKKKEEDDRRKTGIPLGAVVANAPHMDEPLPPGFDPVNLVVDPHDPKVAPPPEHVYPPGWKPPVYRRWWPWTILGGGVAIGAAVALGLVFGLPKFNSELPIGGPGAHALTLAPQALHLIAVHF